MRISTFSTDGERWAALIELLHRMGSAARSAEGCFGAQVCSVEDRPDTLAVVSRWRSRQDLDAFLAERTPAALSELEDLLNGPPATQHLTSLSPQ